MNNQNKEQDLMDLLMQAGKFVDYASEQKKAWDEATKNISDKLILNVDKNKNEKVED